MKLQDSDIIGAARDLRDKQNEELHVALSPLKGRRAPTPLWWAATAAALVLGFFVGRQTLSPLSPLASPTAPKGASVAMSEVSCPPRGTTGGPTGGGSSIIREVIHEVVHDTIYETRIVHLPAAPQQQQTAQAEPAPSPGCSMLCDDIRYDLLSGNDQSQRR